MTILGLQIWQSKEEQHIRAGQRRIGDEFYGLADDIYEARQRVREGMGLPPVPRQLQSRKRPTTSTG